MSLKTKLFFLIVVVPISIGSVLMILLSSTFDKVQTENVFENQTQLLNSVHLVLNQSDAREISKKIKSLFIQPGLENLIIADFTGKIRFAAQESLTGKMIADLFDAEINKNTIAKPTDEGSLETDDLNRKKVLISYFKMDLGDQRLLLLLPKTKLGITLASNNFIYKALATATALFFLFLFASRSMYRTIIRGVKQVTVAMESLAQGQWLMPFPISASGEVGELASQFGKMQKLIYQRQQQELQNLKQQAGANFSKQFCSILLPPCEIYNKYFEVASTVENGLSGGTFSCFSYKKFSNSSHLFFLMGEADPGIDLALLTSMTQGYLDQNTQESDPEICMQQLTEKIKNKVEKDIIWKYCFCSLNLTSGELKWLSLEHRKPTVGNLLHYKPQTKSIGNTQLNDEDFIILHSEHAEVRFEFHSNLINTPTALEFLEMIKPKNIFSKKEKKEKPLNAFDQSYFVVKWRNSNV